MTAHGLTARDHATTAGLACVMSALLAQGVQSTAWALEWDARTPTFVLALAALGFLALLPARTRTGAGASRQRITRCAGSAVALLLVSLNAYDLTVSYRTEAVRCTNGDVILTGTLYAPRSAGRHPLVVFVHGSGAQTSDTVAYYARAFARAGIAAFAFDKRGSGHSTGDGASALYGDLAGDVLANVRQLAARPDIDPTRIGFWGSGGAEWVAPLAAQGFPDTAFVILVSPSGASPVEQQEYELGALVERAGFDASTAQSARALYRRWCDFQRSGAARDALAADLALAARTAWFPAAIYLPSDLPPYDQLLQVPGFSAWQKRMDFDPLPEFEKLACPVLLVSGGRDIEADGTASAARIQAALARGRNPRVAVDHDPDAERGFLVRRLPWNLPPLFFAAGALARQCAWIDDVLASHGVPHPR